MKFGIDISGANKIIDWEDVKDSVYFVIIKYCNIYDEEEIFKHDDVENKIRICKNLKIPFRFIHI